jgi:hypothetical protein
VWANKDMDDADIVVTHTPAYAVVDGTGEGERAGCEILARRLEEIRPVVHVCGHIHNARGVEKVRWRNRGPPPAPRDSSTPATDEATLSLMESSTPWTEPGIGSKKIALVDLTQKGWAIDNSARGGVTRHVLSDSMRVRLANEREAAVVEYQPGAAELSSSLVDGALLNEAGVECVWRRKAGGAMECRWGRHVGGEVLTERHETAMINAAILGQRLDGKASKVVNKPIVVDVELPIWEEDSED